MSYEEENAKLLNEVPSWKDNDVREKERVQMADYLKSEKGYSQSDIESLASATVTANLYKEWKKSTTPKPYKIDPNDRRPPQVRIAEMLVADGVVEDKPKQKPEQKLSNMMEKVREYKARKSPAENHPDYSHKDKLAAINNILAGKS